MNRKTEVDKVKKINAGRSFINDHVNLFKEFGK